MSWIGWLEYGPQAQVCQATRDRKFGVGASFARQVELGNRLPAKLRGATGSLHVSGCGACRERA